jgi:hypothetical protein
MVTVPLVLQRLVDIHGVDARALACELVGDVRTRTWPSTSPGVVRIAALPDDFPRFRGSVTGDRLRITAMRLTEDVVFSTSARAARLTMPWPALPDTLVAALPGRALADLVGHPAIDPQTRILAQSRSEHADGGADMVLDLELIETTLTQRTPVRTTVRATSASTSAGGSRACRTRRWTIHGVGRVASIRPTVWWDCAANGPPRTADTSSR